MTNSMAIRLYTILLLAMASTGCQLVEGIFRAGMWVGIIVVVLVLGLVMLLVGRLRS